MSIDVLKRIPPLFEDMIDFSGERIEPRGD